ncbi:hypothetical protein [Vibrio phage LV6]|nr:hypothetical protein [Vibrio phage LV6]
MRPDTIARNAVMPCSLYSCIGFRCPCCSHIQAHYIADLIKDGRNECEACLRTTYVPVYNLVYRILKCKGYNVPHTPSTARFDLIKRHVSGVDNFGRPIVFSEHHPARFYPIYNRRNSLTFKNHNVFYSETSKHGYTY